MQSFLVSSLRHLLKSLLSEVALLATVKLHGVGNAVINLHVASLRCVVLTQTPRVVSRIQRDWELRREDAPLTSRLVVDLPQVDLHDLNANAKQKTPS